MTARGRKRGGVWFAAVLATFGWAAASEGRAAQQPAAGQLLVASRAITGSGFTESVVLLTSYGGEGAAGLVINRPAGVPVARVLEGLDAAKGRQESVYIGGPVGRTGVMALWRTRAAPAGTTEVAAGVRLVSSRAALDRALAEGAPAAELRVYLGYAGWGAGQLEREIAAGYWHLVPSTAALIFDPKPDTLWNRLIAQAEGLRAGDATRGSPAGLAAASPPPTPSGGANRRQRFFQARLVMSVNR